MISLAELMDSSYGVMCMVRACAVCGQARGRVYVKCVPVSSRTCSVCMWVG